MRRVRTAGAGVARGVGTAGGVGGGGVPAADGGGEGQAAVVVAEAGVGGGDGGCGDGGLGGDSVAEGAAIRARFGAAPINRAHGVETGGFADATGVSETAIE